MLLALFSLSLVIPDFASDPDANLPACCRRDGKHHCSMSAAGRDSKSGAGFQANGKCPIYPAVALSASDFTALQIPATALLNIPNIASALCSRSRRTNLRSLRVRAHHKRGPPSFFILG